MMLEKNLSFLEKYRTLEKNIKRPSMGELSIAMFTTEGLQGANLEG